ncbi:MAG: MarR family transcriptional regulator [Proteobacteria bacterium]|nr:MarR family transcriptional regulator [Pseudomonadota bacterium]
MRKHRAARAIAELIEQFGRFLINRSFATGLNAAQWAALRYVAQADRNACNVGTFARYQLTTPSSASQTISSLVGRGLLKKSFGSDARQRTLELTPKGRKLLQRDPILEVAEVIATLSDEHLHVTAEVLERLIKETYDAEQSG